MGSRVSKDDYYLGIAKSVGMRSTCMRKRFGAIVVLHDSIIATGYNGPPRGGVNCEDVGCIREKLNLPHYAGYDESCPAVHAEENTLINAARNGAKVMDGILYIIGVSPDGTEVESKPCHRCRRALINAGITHVVTRNVGGDVIKYKVSDWAAQDHDEYIKQYRKAVGTN